MFQCTSTHDEQSKNHSGKGRVLINGTCIKRKEIWGTNQQHGAKDKNEEALNERRRKGTKAAGRKRHLSAAAVCQAERRHLSIRGRVIECEESSPDLTFLLHWRSVTLFPALSTF